MGHFVTSDGVKIAYQESGVGRPLILVPGWGASARWFEKQATDLAETCRVIAVDPRFHGASDSPDFGGRISRASKDLNELLEALAIDDAVLLGWSIGVAHVLGHFDLFGSERVAGYALVCGSAKPLNEGDWANGFADIEGAAAFKSFAAADPRTLANTNVPSYFHTPPSDSDLSWMIEDTAGMSPTAADVAFDCIVQDYRDTVRRLDRPTLAIYSESDPIIPASNAEFVRQALPEARVEIFAASGHCPFWEEADRFNEIITDFLATSVDASATATQ